MLGAQTRTLLVLAIILTVIPRSSAIAFDLPKSGVGENQMKDRTIVGYASEWSVHPGETLEVSRGGAPVA